MCKQHIQTFVSVFTLLYGGHYLNVCECTVYGLTGFWFVLVFSHLCVVLCKSANQRCPELCCLVMSD